MCNLRLAVSEPPQRNRTLRRNLHTACIQRIGTPRCYKSRTSQSSHNVPLNPTFISSPRTVKELVKTYLLSNIRTGILPVSLADSFQIAISYCNKGLSFTADNHNCWKNHFGLSIISDLKMG